MFSLPNLLFVLALSATSFGKTLPSRMAYPEPCSLASTKRAFDEAGIPESLTLDFNPKYGLSVSFPQKEGCPVDVQVGEQIEQKGLKVQVVGMVETEISTHTATALTPTFTLSNPNGYFGNGPFVVATVDPDAPTPQNTSLAQVRHILGGNFSPARICDRGSVAIGALTNSTPAISEWLQPNPGNVSDPHRYVFLVFEQPDGFDSVASSFVNATTSVLGFNISRFAEEVGLGSPVAGSFMLVGPGEEA